MSSTSQRPGLTSRPSSMATLTKTIILVTGGNTGIGYEIVKALSSNPNYQVLMGCRDTRKGEAAAASMGAPTNVNPIQCDIEDDVSIENCVKAVEQLFGRLDVLVNNAGTAGEDLRRGGKQPSSREEWHHVFNVNCISTGVFTDAMIPLLEKSKAPKIVFTGSTVGSITWMQTTDYHIPYGVYCASKTAVNMMMSWYSKTYPKIKVNASCPGYRATGLNGAEKNDQTDPALGAVNIVRLINEGPDGATGTFTRTEGPIEW